MKLCQCFDLLPLLKREKIWSTLIYKEASENSALPGERSESFGMSSYVPLYWYSLIIVFTSTNSGLPRVSWGGDDPMDEEQTGPGFASFLRWTTHASGELLRLGYAAKTSDHSNRVRPHTGKTFSKQNGCCSSCTCCWGFRFWLLGWGFRFWLLCWGFQFWLLCWGFRFWLLGWGFRGTSASPK